MISPSDIVAEYVVVIVQNEFSFTRIVRENKRFFIPLRRLDVIFLLRKSFATVLLFHEDRFEISRGQIDYPFGIFSAQRAMRKSGRLPAFVLYKEGVTVVRQRFVVFFTEFLGIGVFPQQKRQFRQNFRVFPPRFDYHLLPPPHAERVEIRRQYLIFIISLHFILQ